MPYASPEAKVEHALLSRLATLVLSPAMTVAWPGQSFPPAGQTKPARYIYPDHDAVTKSRPFLSTTSRQTGSFFVYLMLPLGISTTEATDIGGRVANHFAADHEETVEGVTVRITERPTVRDGYKDETDQRWRVPVVIPYEAFFRAS